MNRRKKKRALTLLEIMIVIFLIGLIGSVIGYNMKGSLDEGKAFKTERAKEQIHDILMLEIAKGNSMDEVIMNKEIFLKNSGIVKDPKKLLKDGWNKEFEITANQHGTDIVIRSAAFDSYRAKKRGNLGNLTPADDSNDSDN